MRAFTVGRLGRPHSPIPVGPWVCVGGVTLPASRALGFRQRRRAVRFGSSPCPYDAAEDAMGRSGAQNVVH
jgi:hypothetical protein